MKYIEKIEERHSIREFYKKAVTSTQKEQIQQAFDSAKHLIPDIDVEMFIKDEENICNRVEGIAGYGGNAFNAPMYLIFLSEKKDNYLENAGFITEDVILALTEIGLENCWLSVNDSDILKQALRIESDKEIVSVVAVGKGKQERTLKRLDILSPSNVRFNERKGHVAPKISQEELAYYGTWGKKVKWDENLVAPQVDQALYAASLAPSFLNRQPYRYLFCSKMLLLLVKKEEMISLENTLLDVGATMLNFAAVMHELNGASGPWKMGIPSGIGDTEKPDEYEIVAYYDLKE